MLENSEWYGVHEAENLRWRVVGVTQRADSPSYLNFYAYERTGLVEGVARTAEQIFEDALRESERN